jgi:hypothetical protein
VRYYKIAISDPSSGTVVTPPGFAGLLGDATYTSFVNGQTLPGAWDVEIDITSYNFDEPLGGGYVRVWGISLQEISQAMNLANPSAPKNITVSAGMQKGLPLANPAQSGVIAQGYIIQAFGNWVGTDMTLDLVIAPGTGPVGVGSAKKPANIVLNWKAGTPLSDALKTTLGTAFPGYTMDINIDPSLVRQYDTVSYHNSLIDLSKLVKQVSSDIAKGTNYSGVNINLSQKTISVFDNVGSGSGKTPAPTQINFEDLIGQPTWVEPQTVAVKCVMRADIKVGGLIKLPQTLVTNTQSSMSALSNQNINFNGNFQVIRSRHNGHYRQADASSWVTDLQVTPMTSGS